MRPGHDFDQSKIHFGQLKKIDGGYHTEILYENGPLYYQFNDCLVDYGSNGDSYIVKNLSSDYELVEQAIRRRLVEESHNMFRKGFTEEMLMNMQKALSWSEDEHCIVPTYTKNGVLGLFRAGEGDAIFQCTKLVFEQQSWRIVWRLIQIRQEQDVEVMVDPEYLFVDDPDDETNQYEDGYESDSEHVEDGFMFMPKPESD